MAQTIKRDTGSDDAGKMAESATDVVGKTVDLATEMVDRTNETLTATTERTLDGVRDMAEQVRAPMARLIGTRVAREVNELVAAEADLARFWVDLARDQLQRNVDALQRLTTVRDWREALEIQNEYMRESLAQMSRGMYRQMDLAGTMTSRLFTAGRDELKDAA